MRTAKSYREVSNFPLDRITLYAYDNYHYHKHKFFSIKKENE